MGSPVTVNKTASIVNEVLAALIEGTAETTIEASLVAQNPWLGLPFIKQIFEFVLGKAMELIYAEAAMAATKLVIDVEVNGEESSVITSFNNLQMAVASGDPNAIAQASKDLSSVYGSLIHFDGSAPP